MIRDTFKTLDWISVKERLPKDAGRVITFDGNDVDLGRYVITDCGSGFHTYNVTHWMPIPEPPKQ